MSLFYKPTQATIENKDGKKLWHLALVKTGKIISTQKLGEKIADKSSLTPGDVHNVIRNLMTVMKEEMMNSHSVRLDGLGTFTMKARTRGKGVETAKEVNPSQVTMLRCYFTPEYSHAAGSTTRALTEGADFIHVNQLAKGMVVDPGEDDDDYVDPEL